MGIFKKITLTLTATALLTVVGSPLWVYLWGLSNLSSYPKPAPYVLSAVQEQALWQEAGEVGIPRIRPLNAYTYLAYIYCVNEHGLIESDCRTSYPGLHVSAFAVHKQVGEESHQKGNTWWQITWMAYTIWVTRHWSVHEILATYHHHNPPDRH
jgi:hypothetical protein